MKPYTTIAAQAQDEFEERRSRFIGTAAPVTTEEEALAFLGAVRSRHKEANHNVYAYCLRQGQLSRFSDDGEPQGTAGKPVLEVLQREGLTDLAVVVTRYFGGVLLGAGGLLRAYTRGAKCAVDASRRLYMCPSAQIALSIGYDLYGKLTYMLPDYGIVTQQAEFGEDIRLTLRIKSEKLPPFAAQLMELSGGMVQPLILEEDYYHFEENL